MRSARLWARLLGVEQAVVERVCFDQDEQTLVVSVRPRKGVRRRCGRCGRRCPGFDQGEGRRRWRALDLGVVLYLATSDILPEAHAHHPSRLTLLCTILGVGFMWLVIGLAG